MRHFFTGFLSLNFVNCYVHQLRMFIFCSITAFTNKLMVWPWVLSLVLFLPTFFLAHRERSWLANCNCNKSLYFSRYIDNCFVIFRSPNHVRPFQDYLNSQHRFTANLHSPGYSPPILIVLFLYLSNVVSFILFWTAILKSVHLITFFIPKFLNLKTFY